MVQLLWKTVRQFLKKLKIELPYGPKEPKRTESRISRTICPFMFIATLLIIAQR